MCHANTRRPTLSSYLTGLGLALVLTIIPFALVAGQAASRPTLLVVIAILGLAQVFVQLRYFLHLSLNPSTRERGLVLLFSVLLITIMAGGTILVMSDLNARMI
jgi:cytochrome o ubiquinol oxidase operon protein cyoD